MRAKLANRFAPGRYLVQCWVHRNHSFAEPLLALPRVLDFVVYGVRERSGWSTIADQSELIADWLEDDER